MEGRRQLPLQTADLIAGFMVWVILSSLLPYIKQDILIPPDQVALVTAIPVVLGSVLRVPIGYWANLYGARKVFLASFIVLLAPVWFLSEAATCQELLVGGTFLGIAGAVFSVGVTSLPKYFPRERHGFVNGVYGFGNMGTALTTWLAPVAAVAIGWRGAVKLYLVLLGAFIVLNFVLGDRDEPRVKTPIVQQLRAIAPDARLWFLSLFYFVTFGAFVALTVYLPNFLTSHYGLDGVSAGIATSVFIVAAAAIRVLGGWLSDRLDCYRLLAGVFAAIAAGAVVLAVAPGLPVYLTGIYLVSLACGIGNGVVFKLVPTYFTKQAGPANGLVAMWGGLGGFFPPLVLSASTAAFGSNVPGLAAFAAFALACLAISLLMRKRQAAA
ncbi:MFS transporter [Arabiibacter massiliensis]|uniref:MFS transporter n=1 Tax=Arabiibacter massiliensis TaxID=1870985 RepID=UPI0009B99DF2|nr:MFS transporter [Arabiibacter massiliensis]